MPKRLTYFLSLSVTNVRCFGAEAQTLDLSDGGGWPAHWTVLLGNNGTGKTTLLECLALMAKGPEDPDHQPGAQRLGVPRGPGELGWGDPLSRERFVRAGGNGSANIEVEYAMAPGLAGRRTKIGKHRGSLNVDVSHRRTQYYPVGPLVYPTCYAYGAARRMGVTQLSSRADSRRDDPAASLLNEQGDLRNAEEWLMRLDYAASKKANGESAEARRLKQVRNLVINVLPDVQDIRFRVPGKDRPTPRVEFKTPDGWVPLQWVGLGYRTAVAWMVDLASRLVEQYPKSKDPLAEPAVVLVDEIDLHLHPVWQRTLMDYLSGRFPNVQFIVTAHSPLFVQAAAGANLAVLRREKDHVIIDNDVEEIRGWRVDQLLTSDLFGLPTARPPQMEGLLAERKKLLTKSKLTAKDKKKLDQLEEKIGALPGGETAKDARTMQLLEETLKVLNKKRGGKR